MECWGKEVRYKSPQVGRTQHTLTSVNILKHPSSNPPNVDLETIGLEDISFKRQYRCYKTKKKKVLVHGHKQIFTHVTSKQEG